MIKIVTVVFGGGVSTLGMSVIVERLRTSKHAANLNIVCFNEQNPGVLLGCDFLLVSLCWFEDVLNYLAFLKKYGIDPRKEKPQIIIGGISALNTRILNNLFHFCVLGDGEVVIEDLLDHLLAGDRPQMKGVVKNGTYENNFFVHAGNIPAHGYVEDRGNNTTRIELARGCRYRCPFCQLAFTKPYREQPIEVVEYLLRKSRTKAVGLFAPDRSGYSQIDAVELLCKKLGKRNTAEDLRLDKVSKMRSVNKLKFGVEGFTEVSRKKFKKVSSNEKLIAGLKHVFTTLEKPSGGRHTTATMYMIGDLPGETPENAVEFWEVLREADSYCTPPFTLFLTLNSFSPKPLTPMEKEGIHPYNGWNAFWAARPRMKNITIAARGGMQSPTNRITHSLVSRGDEKCTRLLFWLATDGHKLFKDRTAGAGRALEKLIRKQGVDPLFVYGALGEADVLPCGKYNVLEEKGAK